MAPKTMRNLRRRLGLTQAAAAALIRVTPNTWARWERGEAHPRGNLQRAALASLPLLAGKKQPAAGESLAPQIAPPGRQSTGRDLLQFAGTWAGKDLEKSLSRVYATRSKATF